MEELNYEELRRIQAREKDSQMLQELPGDFYKKAEELVARKSRDMKKHFSIMDAKEYENILKVLDDIYARRERKIVLKAVKTAMTGEESPGMADGEKMMFDSMVKLLKEYRDKFESLLKSKEESKEDGKLTVRFLVDMPEFFSQDKNAYGPFKKGEVATLPEKEAMLLLKKNFAEEIRGAT